MDSPVGSMRPSIVCSWLDLHYQACVFPCGRDLRFWIHHIWDCNSNKFPGDIATVGLLPLFWDPRLQLFLHCSFFLLFPVCSVLEARGSIRNGANSMVREQAVTSVVIGSTTIRFCFECGLEHWKRKCLCLANDQTKEAVWTGRSCGEGYLLVWNSQTITSETSSYTPRMLPTVMKLRLASCRSRCYNSS